MLWVETLGPGCSSQITKLVVEGRAFTPGLLTLSRKILTSKPRPQAVDDDSAEAASRDRASYEPKDDLLGGVRVQGTGFRV